MNPLQKEFQETAAALNADRSQAALPNQIKLKLYGLYKQATLGDAKDKPSKLDMVGSAKFLAWQKFLGMESPEAMQKYIDEVKAINP